MNVHINLGNYGKINNDTLTQRIQFVLSPVNEMFRSLHVLLNPRHHGQNLEWALKVKNKVTPSLYADLNYFSILYELETPDFLIPNLTRFSNNIDSELETLFQNLKKQNNLELANHIKIYSQNRKNSFIPKLAKSIEWSDYESSTTSSLLDDLIQKPSYVYKRFTNFIKTYCNNIFKDTLNNEHIIQELTKEIKKETLYLKNGFPNLINNLQTDRIFWNKKEIIIIKPFEQKINIGNNGSILLIPSIFMWPHLFVSKFQNNVLINYGFSKNKTVSSKINNIQKIFYALSDETRLKILNNLHNNHQTTQSLASYMHIGMSTISRHLQILKETNLITSYRQGKYVIYQTSSLITDIIPCFFEYLTK